VRPCRYKKALDIDPNDAVTLYNYGLLLENAHRNFDEAEKMSGSSLTRFNALTILRRYQKALQADPRHVDTLCNYGALLKTVHKQYKTAEEM